jgi:hypothetical protein
MASAVLLAVKFCVLTYRAATEDRTSGEMPGVHTRMVQGKNLFHVATAVKVGGKQGVSSWGILYSNDLVFSQPPEEEPVSCH